MTNTSFNLQNGIFLPFSPEATGVGIPGQFTTWSTDNAIGPAGTPSGALLDQLTGFNSTGILQRTGVGAYSFLGSTSPLSAGVISSGAPTPFVEAPTVTTATSTSGSPTIIVASAAGLRKGQLIVANFASDLVVTNIVGTTVTMNGNATATNSTATPVTFGIQRLDPTSAVLANSVGATNLWVGAAALGNSSWLSLMAPGLSEFPSINTLVSLAPNGIYAGIFGSRVSDNTAGYTQCLPLQVFCYFDAAPAANVGSWAAYFTSVLASGTDPSGGHTYAHVLQELSVVSHWTPVATDPFNHNPAGGTRCLRLDSGMGPSGPTVVSNALDICGNGSTFTYGINFTNDAFAANADMIRAASGFKITWYTAAATPGASITGDGTGALVVAGNINAAAATTYDLGASGDRWRTVFCGTLNTNNLLVPIVNLNATFTVGGLVAASSVPGDILRVSDGTAALALGATVTGGGSTPYLVWSNGTAWTIIGK